MIVAPLVESRLHSITTLQKEIPTCVSAIYNIPFRPVHYGGAKFMIKGLLELSVQVICRHYFGQCRQFKKRRALLGLKRYGGIALLKTLD